MSDFDASALAAMVRGLYLGELSWPVALASTEAAAAAADSLGLDLSGAKGIGQPAAVALMKDGLSWWRSQREGAPGLVPGCVLVKTAGGSVAFWPGASLDEARLRSGRGDSSPWAARAPWAVDPKRPWLSKTSAEGRSAVVEGRIALVTGGAQGFGEEIVRGLAASGALVFVADLNLAGAERLAAELNAVLERTAAVPLAIDVADEKSVSSAIEAAVKVAGGLDLVVSNAGVLKAGSVLDMEASSFRLVTDVNYTGFFYIAKHAGRVLRAQASTSGDWSSDIVQINSKSGLEGSNRNGAYAGSKFGSIGLVQSFALELVEYGIKVNAICPGNFFDGPLWSDPVKGLFVQYLQSGKVPGARSVADVKAFYEAKVPMGRGCEGSDVMRALYYLVEQVYETGQALPVTGGQVMLA